MNKSILELILWLITPGFLDDVKQVHCVHFIGQPPPSGRGGLEGRREGKSDMCCQRLSWVAGVCVGMRVALNETPSNSN